MSNYTEEQTNMMVGAYLDQPTPDTVERLAEELGRSKKSIIGKLSREGVYRREVYVSKTGESPITKVEIVNNIVEILGIESGSLAGLEKSPKAALKNLEKAITGSVTIKIGTENHELDVPKWTMTEDPYGDGIVSIDWNVDDMSDPHLTYVTCQGGPDPKWDIKWDLENDPEYEPNVPIVTLKERNT